MQLKIWQPNQHVKLAYISYTVTVDFYSIPFLNMLVYSFLHHQADRFTLVPLLHVGNPTAFSTQ